MASRWFSLLGMALIASFAQAQADPPLEYEQTPSDPKAAKIVLVGGAPNYKQGEHEFNAGCFVLSKLLQQTPGVAPVLVKGGWPTKADTFAGAKTIVFFHDGGDLHFALKGDRMAELAKLAESGVGLVHLHTIIDYPKDLGARAMPWMGGVWQKGFSQRSHWIADFKSFPDHPVTRGVTPFKVDDGWLWKHRWMPDLKGVTPLARTLPPKTPKGVVVDPDVDGIVGWAYERPGGGRSFVFTGGHLHTSWGIPGFRQFIVNGILWSAGLDIPQAGAPVVLDPADLARYVEPRPTKKK